MTSDYVDALHECLHMDDTERREFVAAVPTVRLNRWAKERGNPGSWCEVFREIVVEELDRRG